MAKLSPKDYGKDGRVGIKNVKLPKGADATQKTVAKKNTTKKK